MLRSRTVRNRLVGAAVLCLLLGSAAKPAHAVSKEMVELQTQVQQLLDMVQRLQSTMDSRFGVMQHLAEQTADAANQVSATVNAMQQKLNAQNDAVNGKVDTVSGQVQSLNDSVDELKARVAKLDKTLQDMQAATQEYAGAAAAAARSAVWSRARAAVRHCRSTFGSPGQRARGADGHGPGRSTGSAIAGDIAGRRSRLRCRAL